MTHTFFAVYIHFVWSTKHRKPWITPELSTEIYPYIATLIRNHGSQALLVGGHRDHVHALVGLANTTVIPDLVKETKRISSTWLKGRIPEFGWQDGYGAFSVSYSNIGAVRTYIQRQEDHHRRMSWEEEFRSLLEKHGVEYDERYFLD